MRKQLYRTSFIVLLSLLTGVVYGQHTENLLYGTVTTVDGETFKGQLQWGGEESTWENLFNATKAHNPYIAKLDMFDKGKAKNKQVVIADVDVDQEVQREAERLSREYIRQYEQQAEELEEAAEELEEVIVSLRKNKETEKYAAKLEDKLKNLELKAAEIEIKQKEYEERIEKEHAHRLVEQAEKARAEAVSSWNFNFMNVWVDHHMPNTTHQFVCYFGDIARLELTGGEQLMLYYKNGSSVELRGGSNDVGAEITVLDEELGEVKVPWKRIKKVAFEQAPRKLKDQIGLPLYGTVKTSRGTFTGLIQWDKDEALTIEKLDGQTSNGKLSITFDKIKKISKTSGNRSQVTLVSDREVVLYGTNDVNSGNRGIYVSVPSVGLILISWEAFESVEFDHDEKSYGLSYNDFKSPKPIKGTLKTKEGEEVKGEMAYDLDEYWNLEMLDGRWRGLEYAIPFRNIKKIKPETDLSEVTLTNGEVLLLKGTQDVGGSNDGVMVFTENTLEGKKRYFTWKEIAEIQLD
ncbi:hypothetical protein [Algivirga pacifica]|uniref:Uncharacterized protein n=1 Tax=Algivirga pacifica TaxID=1162670 RepID=A0ABP9DLP5_9BACT